MAVKASIYSLPTEIKTRIGELCHLQDEVIRAVFYRLDETAREPTLLDSDSDDEDDFDSPGEEETKFFKLGPFTDGRVQDSGYPKSLLSLSSVSREWRDIAIKIMFRELDVRKCSKSIFLYALAPRYGHLVEELGFASWSGAWSATNVLTSLAYLPNVRKIALPMIGDICHWLGEQARDGGLPVDFASPEFVTNALQRVTLHADVVVLPEAKLEDMVPMIRGAALSKLELTSTREDLPTLLSAIMDCPNLRTLTIETAFNGKPTFRDAALLPNVSHPTLRRLEISDLFGGEGLYDFVQRFGYSLEELEVFWGLGILKEVKPPDPRHFRLPRLRQLDVRGDFKATASLMRSISPAIFPALQDCTWVLYGSSWSNWRKDFLTPVADAIRHLRTQRVDRAVPLKVTIDSTVEGPPPNIQRALEALGIAVGVEQSGVVVGIGKRGSEVEYEPTPPPGLILTPKLCRTDGSKIQELGKTISVSLDRIRDLKDQAVAVGDRVQVSRIAHALQEGEWLCVERQC